MVKHNQAIIWHQLTHLSVFDHFWGLALEGLSETDFMQLNYGEVLPQTLYIRTTYNFANIKIDCVKNQSTFNTRF